MKIEKIEVHPFKIEGVLPRFCGNRMLKDNTYTDTDFKKFLEILPGNDFTDTPWNLTDKEEEEVFWNKHLSEILPTLSEEQITKFMLIDVFVMFDKGRTHVTLAGLQPGTRAYIDYWHNCVDTAGFFHYVFCTFVTDGVVRLHAPSGTKITGDVHSGNHEEVGNNINPRYNTPNDSTFFSE